MDQLALMHNKSSSGARYGQLNTGVAVRDPSSMFMFGDTKLINGVSNKLVFSQAQNRSGQPTSGNSSSQFSHFQGLAFKSPGLLTKNENLQAGIFGKSSIGDKTNGSSTEDMVTLDPLEQKILFNTEDEPSGGIFESMNKAVDFPSLQSGSWSALMESAVAETSSSDGGAQEEWSGLSFQKPDVPKAEIDEDALTPSYSNNSRSPYVGLRLTPPSQRPIVNCSDPSRISKQAETSHHVSVKKEDGEQWSTQPQNRWMDVPGQQISSAICEPPCTSYTTKSRMGTASGSLSGNIEADGLLLKQVDSPPHNVISVKAALKREREHCDNKIPQITSPCYLNFAYGNDKSHPFDQLAKNLSQPHGNQKKRNSLMQHLDVPNQIRAKSKKRRYPTYERLPWHKEVAEVCSWLYDMSTAELEWVHAVGRLPEKSKEQAKGIADPLSMVHYRKRRLNITTQLMQLLFRAPAVILSEDAAAHCDSVTYHAARLALADACNLCSTSGKNITFDWSSDLDLSKTVEALIDKSKRLQDQLSRMEEGESTILEVRLDYQNLEKFSVTNRFAKFHARGELLTGDTESSGVSSSNPKVYSQRLFKVSPMPDTIPEGQKCISL
uniref:uncharacterized protein LOC122605896 n=1 Tax=Erigeron canadensis TaxID=72917 RepID=UPI001CB9D5AA|nr:uncharacterized protein LOC122605896 [Erigeron canadensis]